MKESMDSSIPHFFCICYASENAGKSYINDLNFLREKHMGTLFRALSVSKVF